MISTINNWSKTKNNTQIKCVNTPPKKIILFQSLTPNFFGDEVKFPKFYRLERVIHFHCILATFCKDSGGYKYILQEGKIVFSEKWGSPSSDHFTALFKMIRRSNANTISIFPITVPNETGMRYKTTVTHNIAGQEWTEFHPWDVPRFGVTFY